MEEKMQPLPASDLWYPAAVGTQTGGQLPPQPRLWVVQCEQGRLRLRAWEGEQGRAVEAAEAPCPTQGLLMSIRASLHSIAFLVLSWSREQNSDLLTHFPKANPNKS